MFVQQFFVKGLAHSSYLLGGTNSCAIIDPRRDVQLYIDAAKDMNMTITHILETHLHADFVSGHRDLAEQTGAKIFAPGKCEYPYTQSAEGVMIELDDLEIKVVETPGHTPEHVSYIVTDTARGAEPVAVFCGDTLFVGDVGRPDLFPGIAKELAGKLYDSLHQKLLALPDACEVYPAHGAGSLCGRAMGAKRTSTVGYEKLYNSALQIKDKEGFITSLTTNMPGAPDHFKRCSATNGAGPALVRTLPAMRAISPREFILICEKSESVVLDTRSYDAFGGQHVPRAFNIDFGSNFVTFAGWIIPPDKDILLVTENPAQACEATLWLHRVGLDTVVGFLEGGMFGWAKAGLPAMHVSQLSAHDLRHRMLHGSPLTLVDVRAPREFEDNHIEGAVNIPVHDLRSRYEELDPQTPVALICSTGHRSSLAASILKMHGFMDVYNVAGGMTGFSFAGYAPQCPMCVIPHGPTFMGR